MCGLAFVCRASRSVKNPCRIGARSVTMPPARPACGLEPAGGQGEELRDGLQVPVGGLRVDVAEPGGQQREPGLDVPAVAVPVQQRRDGEGMPQVVQPRARRPGGALMPAARPAGERLVDVGPSSGLPRLLTRNVPARGSGNAWSRAAHRRAARRPRSGGGTPARTCRTWSRAIDERPVVQVDVVAAEAAGLALAHAGHGQQADQRPPGRRPERRRESRPPRSSAR